jgi:hypothetical protein
MNRTGFDRFVMRASGAFALAALAVLPTVAHAMADGPPSRKKTSGAHGSQTPVDHIVITASPGTLFTGVTIAHSARGVCKDGTERKLIAVWRSSDPDVATVDRAGNVTALKIGIVTITAEVDGVRGAKTYAITKKPAERFLIDLPNKPIRSGDIV